MKEKELKRGCSVLENPNACVTVGRTEKIISGGYFTVKQVAARWQVSDRTVQRFIKNGRLSSLRLGRSRRIPEAAVAGIEADAASVSSGGQSGIYEDMGAGI